MKGGDSVSNNSKSAYSKHRGGGSTHKTRVNNNNYYSKRKGGWKHSQKHMTLAIYLHMTLAIYLHMEMPTHKFLNVLPTSCVVSVMFECRVVAI